VAETDVATGGVLRTYTHGLDLIRENVLGQVAEAYTDVLGSVGALLPEGKPAGMAAQFRYDAFGGFRTTAHPGGDCSGQPNALACNAPMTYTGHLYDPETGLFYFGARYYDPETGRFLTHDPVAGDALNPPSLHKYLYAYSSPMTYVDPWGEDAWTKDFNETGREYEREHRKFSVTVSQNQNVEGVQKSRVYIEPESHDINLYGYSGGNTQVYRIPKGYAQDHPVAAYEMLTSAGQLTPKQALDALSFVGVQIAFGSPAYRKIFCQAANTYSIAYGKHVARQWIENMAGMAVGEIVGPVAGRLVGAASRALARTEGDAVAQTLIKSEDELGTMTGREFIPRSATTEAGARKALTDQAYPELQHFGLEVPPGLDANGKPLPAGLGAAPRNVGDVLDDLPRGKQSHVRTVPDEGAMDDLFNQMTKGAETVDPGLYPGVVKKLPDGSVVRMRPSSKSGGATMDITLPDGTLRKVHTQ